MANGVAATDNLENLIVDCLQAASSAERIQSGTGTTTPAVTDNDLVTPVGSRVAGTASQPSSNIHQVVGTTSYTGANAITEVGLFDAASAADCCFRAVFDVINVANGDSIEWTIQITMAGQTA